MATYNPLWDTKGFVTEVIIDDSPFTVPGTWEQVFCSTENITNQLPQAYQQTAGIFLIQKMDSTTYTQTTIPYTGDNIEGSTSGITLVNQYDFVMLATDRTHNIKIIGGNYWANGKQNIIPSPTANDLVTVNASGQVQDSGLSVTTDSTINNNTQILTSEATQTAIVNAKIFRGGYDASGNTYPSTGGSGVSGTIVAGDFWQITTGGTLGTTVVNIGTTIIALGDNPGQTNVNWSINTAGILSFNNRTGAVVPQSGDYAFNQISGTVAITQGGTGATTQQTAINALTGTQSAGKYLRSDGTDATLSNIQAADVPTLNQNTTGSAGSVSGTNVITNTNLAQAAANTYKGNPTGSLANEQDVLTNTAFNQSFETNTTNIKMDGSVSVGTSNNIPRADHVHPTDTTRQALINSPTNGDIVTTDGTGQTQDGGKAFGNDGTNNTVPTSFQMQSYVTQQLLNTPTLPFVNFATTANITTFSGLGAIDGYTPTAGQFLLVKNQTNNDNSVWIVASGAWTRAYYDSTSGSWLPITTQTTYSQLNIQGGIVNVLNGTINRNLQFQFNIVNPSATFGNTIVYVTALTKLPVRDTFNGYVDLNIGNNTNNNGTQAFPYATVTQDLIGASFPHITYIAASGSNYTETLSLTSAQSNFSLMAIDSDSAGKVIFSNSITLGSANTRYREVGITRSVGSGVPIIISNNNAGRHTFQNAIWITSGTSLMTLPTNLTNWIDLYNIDPSSSPLASIPLPNFTSAVTINVYNQTKYLPFSFQSGATGTNCTINVVNCPKGAVVVPAGFTGTLNYYDGISVNQVITDQTTLNSILANTTLNGFYAVSFASPTGMDAGCIFQKLSAGGFTVNNVAEPFLTGKSSTIYDFNTKKVYAKDGSGAFNGWTQLGSGGGSGTVTSVSVTSANGLAGTVANATTTPAITLSTTVNGVVKGDGTTLSAATSGTDYSAGTSSLATGILKSTTSTGALSIAVAADFPTLNQNTTGSAGSISGTNVITDANIVQATAYTIKGNNTNATANQANLNADQVLDTINLGTSTTNALAINRGGTNTRTQTNNGVNFYDGTKITSNANFTNDSNGNLLINGTSHIIGNGNNTTSTLPVTISGAQNIGTNTNGTITQFQASNGTGTGGSGTIRFQTADSNLPTYIGGYNQVFSSATTFTLNYTMPTSGVNKLLLLQLVYGANTAADASSITYGGVQLQQKVTLGNASLGARTSIWYLTNPPSSGNIIVTIPVATTLNLNVLTFANVNQINAFPIDSISSTAITANPSLNVNSSANDLVIDFLTIPNTKTLTNFGTGQQIVNTNINSSATTNTYSSVKTASANSTTMSATIGASVNQNYIGCTLKQYVPTPTLLGYLPQTATDVNTYSYAFNTISLYKNQVIVLQIIYATNAADASGNIYATNAAEASEITYTVGNLTQSFTLGLSNQNASLVRASVWYLTNPNVGAGTINITLPANASMYIVTNTYYNVDQTTPLYGFAATNGTASPMTGTVTTTENDIAINLAVIANNTVLTAGANQTAIFNASFTTLNIYSSYKGASTTSTSLSYTFTGTQNYNYIRYGLKAFTTYAYNSLQDNLIISKQNILTAKGTVYANAIIPAFVSNSTATGNNKLTIFSNQVQIFNGSLSQNVYLPDATTLLIGHTFELINNCSLDTAIIYVYKANNFTQAVNTAAYYLIKGAKIYCRCIDNTTVGGTWYFEAVNQYFTKTVTISGDTTLTVSATLTAMPGLSLILPYIGTYQLSFNVTSFQQQNNTIQAQKGAYFELYNNFTSTSIAGSSAYGSSTNFTFTSPGTSSFDAFTDTGSGVGCASVSVFHTTTTIDNTIIIRGALDATTGIDLWSLNGQNGDSTMTAQLISMPFIK